MIFGEREEKTKTLVPTNAADCAFPADNKRHTDAGLSKREFMATQIAIGLAVQAIPGGHNSNYNMVRTVPGDAVRLADALIDQLNIVRAEYQEIKNFSSELIQSLVESVPKESRQKLLKARMEAMKDLKEVSITVPTDLLFLGSKVQFTMTFDGAKI